MKPPRKNHLRPSRATAVVVNTCPVWTYNFFNTYYRLLHYKKVALKGRVVRARAGPQLFATTLNEFVESEFHEVSDDREATVDDVLMVYV